MRTAQVDLAVYEKLIRQSERLEILKRITDEDGYVPADLARTILNINEDSLEETGGVKADGNDDSD